MELNLDVLLKISINRSFFLYWNKVNSNSLLLKQKSAINVVITVLLEHQF